MGLLEYKAKQVMGRRWRCQFCNQYVPGNVSKRHHFHRECQQVPLDVREQYRKPGAFRAFLGNGLFWYLAFVICVGSLTGILQLFLPVLVAGVFSVAVFGWLTYRGGLSLIFATFCYAAGAIVVMLLLFEGLAPSLGDSAALIVGLVGGAGLAYVVRKWSNGRVSKQPAEPR